MIQTLKIIIIMCKSKLLNGNITASLACLAWLVFASAAGAQSATITVLGGTPPIPGANDQYQTNMPPGAQQPPGLNYYLDQNPSPGQIFTTGGNSSGYILTSLAIYDAGNSAGSLGAQTFTLYLFTVSGSTATLLTSYTSQTLTLPDSTWFVWTNLGAILQPDTQYAFAMHRNGGGWANIGNVSGDKYADPAGQLAMIPDGGGTMNFSSSGGYDATFDVGLAPITAVVVSQPTFSPYAITLPGTTITASADVSGPTPYYFQWQTDGGNGGSLTNIPGATSSNLVINTTGFAPGNYQYDLVASNNTSSATSHVAVLTVQEPAGIAGVVAVKFGFTGGYATSDAPFPADNTGVATGQLVPPSYQPLTAVGNWNNLLANLPASGSTGGAGGTRAAAINQTWNIAHDAAGNALSGVTLTPGGFDDGWFSGGTECAAGRLLYDCWKFDTSNGQMDDYGHYYATLTFNNLPGANYDVIVYVNDNNGNYWGNMQANSVVAQSGDYVDDTSFGFNGGSADPCDLVPQFNTFAGYNGGNAANNVNYVRMQNVAASGGAIAITAVSFGGGDMGISGVELIPSPDITMTQDILPSYAETTVSKQVVFSAAFADSPAVNVQWLKISSGVTNTVSTGVTSAINDGVITSTLTLNNVQLSDAGFYLAKAVNATNGSDYTSSSQSQLVVSNTPAPMNNVVVFDDARVGSNFYPPWAIDTNADLIYNFVNDPTGSGTPGTFTALGTFGADGSGNDPSVLIDGFLTDSIRTAMLCGGPGNGSNVTYFLHTDSSALGFELTNIVVYGGWSDAGRRDQEYQILYSTVSAPALFIPLITAHYLPADPSGAAIATRTTLVPATGVMAHNVYAMEINWNVTPQYLNGYAFYSEIEVEGTNSTVIATLPPVVVQDITPQAASDVVGGQIVMTASFTNAASVQWLKNGANISNGVVLTATNNGIETSTLTLNNLQLSDTATNGGYSIVATNSSVTASSSACAVTVNPVSAPVNNVIVSLAAQTESATIDPVFVPTWNSSLLTSSLIYNVAPSSSGSGDFTGVFDGDGASLPAVLTDGSFGQDDKAQTGTHSSFSVIGYDSRAGNFVEYSLTNSANGYNLTNITVYGGWSDGGRDGQAYTVSYSTVANTNLIPLAVVNYLPANPNGWYCMSRSTITPASGILASNVAALYFDFTTPTSPEVKTALKVTVKSAFWGRLQRRW